MFGPGLRYAFDFSLDSELSNLFFIQYEDPALSVVLENVLRERSCMYDVGANIGVYTAWASRLVGPAGEVHAFEPVPTTRALLSDLIRQNDLANVTVVPFAVGKEDASVSIRVIEGVSALSSAARDMPGSTVMDVTGTTVDTYVENHTPPDLVKIDVEGLELDVLQGMSRTAETYAPLIVTEMIPCHRDETSATVERLLAWTRTHGYEPYNLSRRLMPLTLNRRPTTNVLLARPDRHAAYLDALRAVRFRRNQTL
jgi:FkbM family methyltransferase